MTTRGLLKPQGFTGGGGGGRERDRERDRQTETERDRQRERNRQRQRETERHIQFLNDNVNSCSRAAGHPILLNL